MTTKLILITLLIAIKYCVHGANILYISGTASPSHEIWDKTLAMGLIAKNHKITFASHSVEKKTDKFTPILFEGVHDKLTSLYDLNDWLDYNSFKAVQVMYSWINTSCALDLETNGFKTIWQQSKEGIKYDLIIFDMTSGFCLYPIIEAFGSPPVIGTSPFGLVQYFTSSFGVDLYLAYNPSPFLPYSPEMSILEKIYNFIHVLYFVNYQQHELSTHQKVSEKFFGPNIKPLTEVEKTFQLLIANSDPVFDYPRAVPPNVVLAGGLHIRRGKALPQDLQNYLEQSKSGAIVFSLGTNLQSNSFAKREIDIILRAFSQLKQNVIWKFESKLENIPSNVLIRKWLPQNDLLAHPNVKLLLTHGGALSTQEAMYHGVPIVGIPFFIDQFVNMRKIVDRKLGRQINVRNITVENILEAINDVIETPIYTKNIKSLSSRYKDQPLDGLDRALFWIEYVLKHGARHLRPAGADLSTFKLLFLDMWIALILVLLIVIYLFKKCIGLIMPTNKPKVKKN